MASWPIVQRTVPRLGVAYAWALPFLTMCRHFQRPAYQAEAFCNLQSIWTHLLCRPRTQTSSNVLASGRKETHASPIYFWWRRFGEPPRNSSRDAALADCWRLRSTVVAEAGVSSQIGPSEPNLQKAMEGNKRRERRGMGLI